MNTSKIDLKKELKEFYSAKAGKISAVPAASRWYLCHDGSGNPNTSLLYKSAVEALFSVSYNLKFTLRAQLGIDYAVMPLEGLWWSENMEDFVSAKKDNWQWTMMILQPDVITPERFEEAKLRVQAKRKVDLNGLELRRCAEERSVQTLHVGPFSEEGTAIAALHEWIQTNGHELTGKHHEIYLSDIRRAAPSAWKTIIRQPYR